MAEYEANGVVAGEVVSARMVRGERGDRAEAVVRASEPRYQRANDVLVVAYDGESARTLAGLLQGVLDRLRDVSFPTIAAIDGAALGAGSQLAIACDLRVAAADASFGVPAAKLGLMVNHWTVQRIATLAGPSMARAILLTAEVVSGADALRVGLVNRQGSLPEALEWAEQIAKLAPLTIAGHKLMLNRLEPSLDNFADVAAAFDRAWNSNDFAEGIDAFRSRRTPVFRGE